MSIKVIRERPSSRLHHRVIAPLFVTVNGTRARARDWSLGGVCVENFDAPLPPVGDQISAYIELPFQGFDIAFDVEGRVVRVEDGEHDTFAFEFVDLTDRAQEILSHFVSEILRGSMVAVEDTIQRIDVPVTPVSTKPDPAPGVEEAPPRFPIKTVLNSALYITLGLLVFGYVGLMLYANYFRMEVQSAVIAAPVESVEATFAGRVIWGPFRPGDEVQTGDILLHVADHELEKSIDVAAIAIEDRKAKLVYLRRRRDEELKRMNGLAQVELKNVEQLQLDVDRLKTEYIVARRSYERLKKLHAKGYTTASRLEEAEARVVGARKRLDSARIELTARVELSTENVGQRHYTGDNFVGDIARIEADLLLAKQQVSSAVSRHEALLKHRSRLAVRAPFSGLLKELPRVDQGSVRFGDVVAVIENVGSRHVIAYLLQDEILKIGLGDEALGYLPSLDETVRLRVVDIDRTDGFIDEANAKYSWRGLKDRSAKVTLAFEDARPLQDADVFRPGLPVIVVFEQRSTNQMASEVQRRLRFVFGSSPTDNAPVADQRGATAEARPTATATTTPRAHEQLHPSQGPAAGSTVRPAPHEIFGAPSVTSEDILHDLQTPNLGGTGLGDGKITMRDSLRLDGLVDVNPPTSTGGMSSGTNVNPSFATPQYRSEAYVFDGHDAWLRGTVTTSGAVDEPLQSGTQEVGGRRTPPSPVRRPTRHSQGSSQPLRLRAGTLSPTDDTPLNTPNRSGREQPPKPRSTVPTFTTRELAS